MSRAHRGAAALLTPPTAGARIRRALVRGVVAAAALYVTTGFVSLRLVRAPPAVPASISSDEGDALHAAALTGAAPGLPLSTVPAMRAVRGALSVHSGRSHDAEGSLDEVSLAARRAGLDFVVLGDHPGAWTGPGATAPAWHNDVLVVGGIELVVAEMGRLLVTGLDADSVARLWDADLDALLARLHVENGFASIIHPRSPRERERWRVAGAGPVHAWEAMDVSEMARRRLGDRWAAYHLASLLGGLVLGRGHESLLRLDREGFAGWGLAAYDSARAEGPLTVTGGLNHHPKGRLLGGPFPAYEPFFRSVVNHVLVPEDPAEDPRREWSSVAAALREGRSFVSMGDPGGARGFRFGAEVGAGWVEMGDAGTWGPGAMLRIRLPGAGRRPLLVRIVGDGHERAWLEAPAGASVVWRVPDPGIYRVEVYRAGLEVGPFRWNMRPWLLSNPVELVPTTAPAP